MRLRKSRRAVRIFIGLASFSIIFACLIVITIGIYMGTHAKSINGNRNKGDNPTSNLPLKPTNQDTFVKPNVKSAQTTSNSSSAAPFIYKPYIASSCVTTVIPYQTIYKNASWLNAGQTSESGGIDGSRKTCTADSNGFKPSDLVLQPLDKTIYVGTYSPLVTPSAPTYTYSQALSLAQQNCNALLGVVGAGSSSAMDQCIQAYLQKYGH